MNIRENLSEEEFNFFRNMVDAMRMASDLEDLESLGTILDILDRYYEKAKNRYREKNNGEM